MTTYPHIYHKLSPQERDDTKRRANYYQIGGPDGLLSNLLPFQGNTMRAKWEKRDYEGSDKNLPISERAVLTYTVYSYRQEIAAVQFLPGGRIVFWMHQGYFSPTTKRQQNLCATWLGGEYFRKGVGFGPLTFEGDLSRTVQQEVTP